VVTPDWIRDWARGHVELDLTLKILERANCRVNFLHKEGQTSRNWGLMVALPVHLADSIGVTREVCVWGSGYEVAQVRDFEKATAFLAANEMRLAQDVIVVVTADPRGREIFEESATQAGITALVLTLSEARGLRPFGQREFDGVVRSRLYIRDLYDLKSPVTRSADFFGRSVVLTQIERELANGSHVGLFGLRKIGKTSFINRLRESLRNRSAGHIAHVDLQRANAINPSASYLLWHIGEALADSNRRIRDIAQLRLFGRFDAFSDIPNPVSVFEMFDRDLKMVLDRTGQPITLILDEIERIYPQDRSSPWREEFVRLWQFLRGVDQEHPGLLRFVISGTNPQCVEHHAILGVDNPIYNYFSVQYLGPLTHIETTDLLMTYGQKMGLNWSAPAIDRAFNDTGGHPSLLRTYASMMHMKFATRTEAVTTRDVDAREIASQFLVRQGPLLSQIVAILEDQYEDEFEILSTLAQGKVHEFRELASTFPTDTAHLIGYGFCQEPGRAVRLSSGLLQTYLQRRSNTRSLTTGQADSSLIGELVDGTYRVESLISSSGGFADVFRASHIGDPDRYAAIKVLRQGKLSNVEREVELLQRYVHANIVKFYGFGRLPDERVYLAMEYLDGQTLESYCEAATKPPEHMLLTWAYSLLDALVTLHPKESELRRMRAQNVSSVSELMEARYGFIHRDIKPENVIVVASRPVLIDFNISVSASTPVATVSATPGYLPVELLGPTWSPRVDLFQLGLTLIQVAAGHRFDGENRDDLIDVMRRSISAPASAFLERLSDKTGDGYLTAYTARQDVERLRSRAVPGAPAKP